MGTTITGNISSGIVKRLPREIADEEQGESQAQDELDRDRAPDDERPCSGIDPQKRGSNRRPVIFQSDELVSWVCRSHR